MMPLRPRKLDDGTIVYPKRGWEPPPTMEGYTRKSNNPRSSDAWIFIPAWNQCPYRQEYSTIREGCGCEIFVYKCTHEKQPGLDLTTSVCEECKLRNE